MCKSKNEKTDDCLLDLKLRHTAALLRIQEQMVSENILLEMVISSTKIDVPWYLHILSNFSSKIKDIVLCVRIHNKNADRIKSKKIEVPKMKPFTTNFKPGE